MKSISIIIAMSLFQCKSVNTNQGEGTCCISLEFDGYSENYYNKHDIYLTIDNAENSSVILNYLNDLEEVGFVNTRLVLWKIKIYDSAGERLCELLKLESGKYAFKKSGNLYKNDKLYNYLIDKVQVEKIGAFPVPVTQEIYDDLIK